MHINKKDKGMLQIKGASVQDVTDALLNYASLVRQRDALVSALQVAMEALRGHNDKATLEHVGRVYSLVTRAKAAHEETITKASGVPAE